MWREGEGGKEGIEEPSSQWISLEHHKDTSTLSGIFGLSYIYVDITQTLFRALYSKYMFMRVYVYEGEGLGAGAD